MENRSKKLPDQLAAVLERGLLALQMEPRESLLESAVHYIHLMDRWNRKVNLTAVRNPQDMVTRHLLDSLIVAPYVTQTRVLDIGSGAGLPGIPLAMMNPNQEWHLIDSSGKRVGFMREAVRQLKLKNVRVTKTRVEEFDPGSSFPAAIARAFASLREIADNASRLLCPAGFLWAMKGHYPHEELAELPAGFQLVEVHSLEVPGLLEDRHLVQLLYNPET